MDRRKYLEHALGCVTVTTVMAGCLGDNESNETADTETDVATADRTLERTLMESAGQLNKAALSMEPLEDELEEPTAIEFDSDRPRDHLENARDALSRAADEHDAGSDDQPAIETLERYAAIIDHLLEIVDTLAETPLLDEFDSIREAIASAQLEEARTTLESLRGSVEAADEHLAAARRAFDEIDEPRFVELTAVEPDEIETVLLTVEPVFESITTLLTGIESHIDGYDQLEAGRNETEESSYEAALSSFEAARTDLESAESSYEDGRSSAPAGFDSSYEMLSCQTTHLLDATGSFIDGTQAAIDDDPMTALSHEEDAEATLETIESC